MIKENVKNILKEIPSGVVLVAAAKGRSISQVEEAISAGIQVIGENYVKEAEKKFSILGNKVKWHFIGHLQKNKAKLAVKIFDLVETLDSLELAEVLDKECAKINKAMPVLIEINIAGEPQKGGVLPDDVDNFIKRALEYKNLKLAGLMTMGPLVKDIEDIRPFFKLAKDIFERIKSTYANELDFKYLSMGMSDTYKIAIEEGANMVRIGTAIFGSKNDNQDSF